MSADKKTIEVKTKARIHIEMQADNLQDWTVDLQELLLEDELEPLEIRKVLGKMQMILIEIDQQLPKKEKR